MQDKPLSCYLFLIPILFCCLSCLLSSVFNFCTFGFLSYCHYCVFFFISSFVLFFTFTVYILDGSITWFSSWRVPRYKCIFIFLKVLIIFPHFSSNVTAKYVKVVKSRTQSHFVKSAQIRSYFWSVFSCVRTEYGYLLRKSPYSVQIKENTDQK